MHEKNKGNGARVALASLFNAADILVKQEEMDRDTLIHKLLKHLVATRGLPNIDKVFAEIVERENYSDTVIANGIALPHARIEGLAKPYVAIATSDSGISFNPGKPLIHLVLLVLIPLDQPDLYLQIISAMATTLRDPGTLQRVLELESSEEVIRFFERGGMNLPGYICAADIMDRSFDYLRNNDNLKTAIDAFIASMANEIPVLDNEGDMVGIVCARALLKVCLPEYLLWMSDLTPIINFEPFADVLAKEQSASLSDILVEEFTSVQMSNPAVTVAGEMTRHNASVCYVLKERKLMGIINLPHFLNKVFRE